MKRGAIEYAYVGEVRLPVRVSVYEYSKRRKKRECHK